MVVVIIRRPVGRDGFGQFTPLELDSVLQLLPGKDGSVMDLCLVKLSGCARKYRLYFALVEALAVTVIEGDVTYAGPAVLNESIGIKLRHGII